MSKLLRSITSSSIRFTGSSMDVSSARVSRAKGYGKLGPDGTYEAPNSSFAIRLPRKLRIPRLGSRTSGSRRAGAGNGKAQTGTPVKSVQRPSKSFLGRFRVAYEKMMLKAASRSGEISIVPVAKASRVPPALSSVVSTYPVWSAFGSRVGAKVSDLDPGFKLTAVEKKYLEHLKRTASSGRF